MSARTNFRRTIRRVQGLIDLNRKLSQRGRPPRELQDVLRGAVMLALGALDAMVADVIAEAMPTASRAGKLGKRVEAWVKDEPGAYLDLLRAPDPHRALGELVRARLANVTFQRAAAIEDNLRSIINVEVPWARAAKAAGSGTTAAQLRDQLNLFSDRRNQIAHKGDVRQGSAPEGINRDWVELNVNYVSKIGESICDATAQAYGPKRGRPRRRAK